MILINIFLMLMCLMIQIKTDEIMMEKESNKDLIENKQNKQIILINESSFIHCMQHCLQCPISINTCTLCQKSHNCCNWPCSSCLNQTICTQCQQGFSLNIQKNLCVMSNSCYNQYCLTCDQSRQNCTRCDLGWYLDMQMLTCNHCLPHCVLCDDHFVCHQCEDSYYPTPNNDSCISCGVNCYQCKNGDKCDQCVDPFFVNQNGKCQQCMESCMNCNQKDYCQKCVSGYYFDTNQKKCIKCQLPCSLCTTRNNCITCIENFYLNQTDKTCKSCNQAIQHCHMCKVVVNYNYYYNNINNNYTSLNASSISCLSCQDHYYLNKSKNICLSCISNCKTCIDISKCIDCDNKFFLNQSSQCQICSIPFCSRCKSLQICQLCQPGYYWNTSSTAKYPSCQKCINGCQYCNQSTCFSCNKVYYIKNGHCYRCDVSCQLCYDHSDNCLKCVVGYFNKQFSGKCYKCIEPCVNCKNLTMCYQCMSGYYEDKGLCKKCHVQNCYICKQNNSNIKLNQLTKQYLFNIEVCLLCQQNYYLTPNNDKCLRCMIGCKSCYNQSQCIQCNKEYYMNSFNICLKCEQNCKQCIQQQPQSSNKTICTNCNTGFYLDNPTKRCIKCQQHCINCVQNICFQCQSLYYLKQFTNGSYHVCKKCVQPCKQCLENNICLSCIQGYYLNNKDQCVKCSQGCVECNQNGCVICYQKYYLDHVKSTCKKCKVDNCIKCNKNQYKCDLCEDGYTHYIANNQQYNINSNNNNIIPISSSSYSLPSISKQLCFRCDQSIQGCKYCSSPFICLSCFNGLNLQHDSSNHIVCNQNHDIVLLSTIITILVIGIIILSGNFYFIFFIKFIGLYIYKNKKYNELKQQTNREMNRSLVETYSINYQDEEGIGNKQGQMKRSLIDKNNNTKGSRQRL